MPGASLSFWDLNGSSDPVEASVLESFTVISAEPVLPPPLRFLFPPIVIPLAYRLSFLHPLFHPPLATCDPCVASLPSLPVMVY
jgi:hypothetical protein